MNMALLTKKRNAIHIPDFSRNSLHTEGIDNISDVLHLVQLSDADIEALFLIDDLFDEHARNMAERHYQMIMEIQEIKEIFEKHTTYERYTSAIIEYYLQLSKPVINQDYIQYRKKIGHIHSQIKLSEEWFIGSYMRVYEYIIPY